MKQKKFFEFDFNINIDNFQKKKKKILVSVYCPERKSCRF